MNKLGLKKDTMFCYSVCESSKKAFIKKVTEIDKQRKCMIELRIDYLLCEGYSIEQIADMINYVKANCTNKKLLVTMRTISEGGKVDLTKEKYFFFIKELYQKSKAHAIDVEYKYYKIDKKYYDSLFKMKKKDVIISMHIFNRVFFENEYKNMFLEMAESKGDIIKFAVKTFTKNDLFTFMNIARKSYKLFKSLKKKVIFIAIGELGKVSRIFPEYTHTSIVFLNAYVPYDKNLGQLNDVLYNKYRKLLDKKRKN